MPPNHWTEDRTPYLRVAAVGGERVVVFILAGGVGERLWPWSTPERPKPFCSLPEGDTLLGMAWRRAKRIDDHVLVVLNRRHLDLARALFPDLSPEQLILEEASRGTARAMAAALEAYRDRAQVPDREVCVFLPADTVTRDEAVYAAAVQLAARHARQAERFVLVGVPAHRVETGFGHILAGALLEHGAAVHAVDDFMEKPRPEAAAWLLRRGALWNTGVVAARLGLFREHLAELPEAAVSFDALVLDSEAPKAVVQAEMDWDDFGTWGAFARRYGRETAAQGPSLIERSPGALVLPEPGSLRPVVVCGLPQAVVVEGPEALLVARRDLLEDPQTLAGLRARLRF
jgi:mannose-1-phosphate guanylyltransferase